MGGWLFAISYEGCLGLGAYKGFKRSWSHLLDAYYVFFRVSELSICQPYGMWIVKEESNIEFIYRRCEIGDVLEMYLVEDLY